MSGETVSARDVYKSLATFKPVAIHVFTANALPRFGGGMDAGVLRRIVPLRFDRTIPTEEVIPDIAKLIGADLGLLLAFAVAGAVRLKRRGSYSTPVPSSHPAMKDWEDQDAFLGWFSENTVTVTEEPRDGWAFTGLFYANYKAYFESEGFEKHEFLSHKAFSHALKGRPGVSLFRAHEGRQVIGLRLKRCQAF